MSESDRGNSCSNPVKDFVCLFEGYVEDILDLKHAAGTSAAETRRLVDAQTQLTGTLNALNENLERGFHLGGQIVGLFGRMVFVFLLTSCLMGAVVVYVTGVRVSYKDMSIQPNDSRHDAPAAHNSGVSISK